MCRPARPIPAYLPVTFLHCRNNASIIEKTTMPGGEFHAGESGLLPQRHRPHLSADAAGPGVPQAGLFQPGLCGQAQRFRLQGGAAGHALEGSGGIRLLHRVGRPLCALLLSGHPGLHPSDRSPQLVLPGAPPAGGIHPGGLPQQHRSAWGRLFWRISTAPLGRPAW